MSTLKVLSYNVWFSPIDFTRRMRVIKEIISNHDPDIICFQELIVNSFNYFRRTLSEFKCNKSNLDYDYESAIFTKFPMRETQSIILESRMGRTLELTKVEWEGIPIEIGTFHLESEFKDITLKVGQFRTIFSEVSEVNAILMGDTNITDQNNDLFVPPGQWVDVWEVLGKDQSLRYTFDGNKNPHVEEKYQNRLDRQYFRGEDVFPVKFDLIGTQPVNGIYPSDHFGIITHFKCNQ